MTTTFKWATGEGWQASLSTGLNSLADGSSATAGSAITNGTDLYKRMAVSLQLASLTPTGAPYVSVHVLYLCADGSTYSDVSPATRVGVFSLNTGAGAQNDVIAFDILPVDFKLAVVNHCNVSLAASGNVVKTQRFNEQGV